MVRIINLSVILGLVFLVGCANSQEDYIDFIKVSDNTYLGVTEIQSNLDVPWDIQFNESSHSIFFTEIKGKISELDLVSKERKVIYQVPNVYQKRTLGLLGLAIHPNFRENPYLYVCYTTMNQDSVISSELVKLRYNDSKIVESKVLLKIEGATGHNGSRLVFDKEGMLYWATGDAHSLTHAQDSTSLNGKVLRMTDEGEVPSDNPIKDSYVYAWGFRNIQGMAFTSKGHLMTSEHGDAIEDEINWVRALNNYGWIDIEGFHDRAKEIAIAQKSPRTEPIKAWTPVIAPAGLAYYAYNVIPEWDNSLLLVSLKSQSLRVLKLNQSQKNITDEKIFLKDYYGRIRAITTDHKGNIYIATSNKDWNPQKGFPKQSDDRILKLSKINFIPKNFLTEYKESSEVAKDGKSLYTAYCGSCHKDDGKGLEGYFPPLVNTSTIKNETKFVQTLLNGLSGEIVVEGKKYNQMMPSFSFLSNEDLSKITSYVRSNFGNKYNALDSNVVNEIRTKK